MGVQQQHLAGEKAPVTTLSFCLAGSRPLLLGCVQYVSGALLQSCSLSGHTAAGYEWGHAAGV